MELTSPHDVVALTRRRAAADLAGPKPLTFREVLTELGRSPRTIPVPARLSIAAVRIYKRLATRPLLKVQQLERLAENKAFDTTNARQNLDFAARQFSAEVAEQAAAL